MSTIDDMAEELFGPQGSVGAAQAEAARRVHQAECVASEFKAKAAERDEFKADTDRLTCKLHEQIARAEKAEDALRRLRALNSAHSKRGAMSEKPKGQDAGYLTVPESTIMQFSERMPKANPEYSRDLVEAKARELWESAREYGQPSWDQMLTAATLNEFDSAPAQNDLRLVRNIARHLLDTDDGS